MPTAARKLSIEMRPSAFNVAVVGEHIVVDGGFTGVRGGLVPTLHIAP